MLLLLALLGVAEAFDTPCQGVTGRQVRQGGGAVLVEDDRRYDTFYEVCGPGVSGLDRDDYLLAWDNKTGKQVAVLQVVDGDASPKPSWVRVYGPDLAPQTLEGLGSVSVRKVKRGEDLVSGHRFAKVVGVGADGTLTLNIGFGQGVRLGFQYAVLGEQRTGGGINAESFGRPALGVLEVVRVEPADPNHCVAVAKEGLDLGSVQVGQTQARFLAKAPPPPPREGQVRVVLAAFDSPVEGAGERYMDVLHRGLQDLIDGGQLPKNLEVLVSDEAPPAEGYTEQTARALGQKLHAAAVLWGSLRCGGQKSCAIPRWTVVEPTGASAGGSLTLAPAWLRNDDIGLRLDDPALLPAVAGLALVSLGRFEDAVGWLGKALDGLENRRDADEVSQVLFGYQVEALDLLGRWDDGLVEVARWERTPAARSPMGQADAVNARGLFLLQQGAYGEAERAFAGAQKLSAQQGDQAGVATAVGNLGLVHMSTGRYAAAEKAFFEHRRLAEALGDPAGVARAIGNLGIVYLQTGRYPEAEKAFLERRHLAETSGDPAGLATSVGNLGCVYAATGRYAEAEKALVEHRRLAEALGNPAGVARAIGNLGNVYQDTGRYAEAEKAFIEGRRLFEALGNRGGVATAVGNLGNVYMATDRIAAAEKAYLEAQRLAEALGDSASVARSVGNLGAVYTKTGRYAEAEKAFLENQRLAEAAGDLEDVSRSIGNLGLLYKQIGRDEDAVAQLTDSVRRFASLGIPPDPFLGPLLSLQFSHHQTSAATMALQLAISQSHSLDAPVIASIATQAIPWARARQDEEGLLLALLVLRSAGTEDLQATLTDLEARVPKAATWARLDLPALSKELQQHILAVPVPPADLTECARTCWDLNDAHALQPGVTLQTCRQQLGCGP